MKYGTIIEIPKGIEGEMNFSQFDAFCKHFECELLGKTHSGKWQIGADDPTDIFWLGANLFMESSKSSISQTVLNKFKRQ